MRRDAYKTPVHQFARARNAMFLAPFPSPCFFAPASHPTLPMATPPVLDHDMCVPCAANSLWARYLIIYLYAVSDEDYDDDDAVSSSSSSSSSSTCNYRVFVTQEVDCGGETYKPGVRPTAVLTGEKEYSNSVTLFLLQRVFCSCAIGLPPFVRDEVRQELLYYMQTLQLYLLRLLGTTISNSISRDTILGLD